MAASLNSKAMLTESVHLSLSLTLSLALSLSLSLFLCLCLSLSLSLTLTSLLSDYLSCLGAPPASFYFARTLIYTTLYWPLIYTGVCACVCTRCACVWLMGGHYWACRKMLDMSAGGLDGSLAVYCDLGLHSVKSRLPPCVIQMPNMMKCYSATAVPLLAVAGWATA